MRPLHDFPDFLQMLALIFEKMFSVSGSRTSFTFSGSFLSEESSYGIDHTTWAQRLAEYDIVLGYACTCAIQIHVASESSPPLFVPNEAIFYNGSPVSLMLQTDDGGSLEYIELFFDDEKGFAFLSDVIDAYPTDDCTSCWSDSVRTLEDFERKMGESPMVAIEV